MPNQRKDGKRNKNVWLTESERDVVSSIRKILGLKNDTEVFKRAITDLAKKEGIIE